jgi:hypothetical protein
MCLKTRKGIRVAILSSLMVLIGGTYASAKTWTVYSSMPLPLIQSIIDGATDGDTILFTRGIYDWSYAPFSTTRENTGALIITDKTLKISGQRGAVLRGTRSELNGYGFGESGIKAFYISNTDGTKDITFDGLTFETFLMGIGAYHCESATSLVYSPNLRNVTIKNCRFADIDRNGIAITGARGDVDIINVDISTWRIGIIFDWYWVGSHDGCQPADKTVRIADCSIQLEENTSSAIFAGIILGQPANIIITRNQVLGGNGSQGISLSDLSMGGKIDDNRISQVKHGIFAGGERRLSPDGVWVPFEMRNLRVSGNDMSEIGTFGINLDGGDEAHNCQVVGNKVDMLAGSISGCYAASRNTDIVYNIISGAGSTALNLGGYINWDGIINAANGANVHDNNVRSFLPDRCHYLLEEFTHDNRVVGIFKEKSTYLDLGFGNTIINLFPAPAPASSLFARSFSLPPAGSAIGRTQTPTRKEII